MDRSGTEDTCQFMAGIILSYLEVVKKSTLVNVSEPHLGGVCEDGKDNARENPSPGEEGKSTDRVT
jgi:hypothetical protein